MKSFIKKSLITLAVFAAALLPTTFLDTPSVSARELGSCESFGGLTSWDCGAGDLNDIHSEDELQKDILIIAGNVATDITVVAAYLVIGYVIYGGYLYIFSAGDPGKVANGKRALSQAFIGLAIVMSANIILNSIRIALVGNNQQLVGCATSECVSINDMVENAIQWVIGVAGVISLIFVVYGGISYTTSMGDPGKIQTAKRMITYALIGLAIVALAEIITAFVSNLIRDANTATSIVNQITISKEVHDIKTI